jgi:GNAT superfamily N-acetyltransferase
MDARVDVRPIAPEATWPLRQSVLRPHQDLREMEWPHDHEVAAIHFGAFAAGVLVGVASLVPDATPDGEETVRLRGMAVVPEHRGKGIGAALLSACIAHADGQGASLWCNARTGVEPFYLRVGFVRKRPDAFDVPGVGPHVCMKRPASVV